MKKENAVTNLLGITQLDLAMLLRVHTSQVSMYCSGKRALPLHASVLLGEMLVYLNTQERADQVSKPLQNQIDKQLQPIKQKFEELLRENEYQQLRLAREIKTTSKKLERQSRMLLLSEFLANRDRDAKNPVGNPESLASKTVSRLQQAPLSAILIEQQHRQEVLMLEKKLLENKLKKMC